MNSKQQRAKAALDELSRLRLSQREVAQKLNVDPTYIAHINGLGVHPEYHVSEERAKALEDLVLEVRHENARSVIERLPLAVRQTANNNGTVVDESIREQICQAIQVGLANSAANGGNATVDLPSGIYGAYVAVGDNIRISVTGNIVATTEEENATRKEGIEAQIKMLQSVIQQCRLQIHEIQHQIDELRRELPDDKRPYRPEAAY